MEICGKRFAEIQQEAVYFLGIVGYSFVLFILLSRVAKYEFWYLEIAPKSDQSFLLNNSLLLFRSVKHVRVRYHVIIIAIGNLWQMDEYMTSSSGAAFNFASWSNAPVLLSTETENPKQLPK